MELAELRRTLEHSDSAPKRMMAILELRNIVEGTRDRAAGKEILLTLMNDFRGEVVLGTAFVCRKLDFGAAGPFRDWILETFRDAGSRSTSKAAPLLRLAYAPALGDDLPTLKRMVELRPDDLGVDRIGRLVEFVEAGDTAAIHRLMVWSEGLDARYESGILGLLPDDGAIDFLKEIQVAIDRVRQTGEYEVPAGESPRTVLPAAEPKPVALRPEDASREDQAGWSPLKGLIGALGSPLKGLIGAPGTSPAGPSHSEATVEQPTLPSETPRPSLRELSARAAARRWRERDLADAFAAGSRKCDLCREPIPAGAGFLIEPATPDPSGTTPALSANLITLNEGIGSVCRAGFMTRHPCARCGLELPRGGFGLQGLGVIQARPRPQPPSILRGCSTSTRRARRKSLRSIGENPMLFGLSWGGIFDLWECPRCHSNLCRRCRKRPHDDAGCVVCTEARLAGPRIVCGGCFDRQSQDSPILRTQAALWAGRPDLADISAGSISALVQALQEAPEDVAGAALDALRLLTDPEAIDSICRLWDATGDDRLRSIIAGSRYVAPSPWRSECACGARCPPRRLQAWRTAGRNSSHRCSSSPTARMPAWPRRRERCWRTPRTGGAGGHPAGGGGRGQPDCNADSARLRLHSGRSRPPSAFPLHRGGLAGISDVGPRSKPAPFRH